MQEVLTKLGFPKIAVGWALEEATKEAAKVDDGGTYLLEDSLQILLAVRPCSTSNPPSKTAPRTCMHHPRPQGVQKKASAWRRLHAWMHGIECHEREPLSEPHLCVHRLQVKTERKP